jgi:hypothetical protein
MTIFEGGAVVPGAAGDIGLATVDSGFTAL